MIRCLAKLFLIAFVFAGICVFAACQLFVLRAGKGKIYKSVESIPARDVALVLGTGKLLEDGSENRYFKGRVDAAAQLYKRGKVKHLLVSGDNRSPDHNEPRDMRKSLLARGVPARAITLDQAGVRTLDSIVRAKEIFGLKRFTIVSQREHDERALLIARHFDLDAIAIASANVPFQSAVLAHIHEWLARVKVVLDLYILHTQPRHLGEKIALPAT